jgi:hypothetical protein
MNDTLTQRQNFEKEILMHWLKQNNINIVK